MTRSFQAIRPRFLTQTACALSLLLGLSVMPATSFAVENEDAEPAQAVEIVTDEAEQAEETTPAAESEGQEALEEDETAGASVSDEPAGLTRTAYQPAEGAYIITGVSANMVIDVVSGKVDVEGTGIQTYTSNNSPAQRWFITEHNGHYLIESAMSDYVLQVTKTSEKQGTVTLAASTGADDQLWDFYELDNGTYEIRSVSTGLVLDIKGASTEKKAVIQAYRSNDSAAQQWSLSYQKQIVDDGIYTISSALNNKMVLDVPKASLLNGANLQLWTSNGSIAQKWALTYEPRTGYYFITSVNSGKALTIEGVGSNGDKLCQDVFTGEARQLWCLVRRSNGQLVLVSATAGRCIDVPSSSAAKGTQPQLYTRSGSEAQGWVLTPTQLVTSGLYKLTSRLDTSKLVDVAGGSLESDAKLQIYKGNGSLAQKWVVNAESDEKITIMNAASGMYLCDTGSALQGTDDPSSAAAQWKADDSPAGGITFINVSTGKAIDISGGKKTNGTPISVHKYNGTIAQSWRLDATTPVADGMYTLLNRADKTKVLDVKSASKAKGGVVQLWSGNGTNAQKWEIKSLGSGLYTIANVNSELVLDVKGGSISAGTALQQWTSNGTIAQKWKISIGAKGGLVFTSAGGDFCVGLSGETATKGAAAVLATPGDETTSAWVFSSTKRAEETAPLIGEKAYVAPAGVTVSVTYQNQMIARANATRAAVTWSNESKKYLCPLFSKSAWNSLSSAEQELVQSRGSATDWYITVEKGGSSGYGTKVCVLHYNNGAWQVVRNFRANTASTFSGRFVINHKEQSYWLPGHSYYGTTYTQAQIMEINPYWMCYVHEVGSYGGNVESGQGFHGGYSSKGCIAMPDGTASNGGLFGDAEWLYNNVPVHTTVDLF